MSKEQIRPHVIVYELNRAKYAHLSEDYKFTFFNPTMYRLPETRFHYFITHNDEIRDKYNDMIERGGMDIKELKLINGKLVEASAEIELEQSNEAVEPIKVESEATLPEVEEEASQDVTEAPVESEQDSLAELSWTELRSKASEAGLEGRFNKEEALEFLRNQ